MAIKIDRRRENIEGLVTKGQGWAIPFSGKISQVQGKTVKGQCLVAEIEGLTN